ncbi:MAG: hypothetical protein E6G66_18460, partial [Actinobacteria bacterium]
PLPAPGRGRADRRLSGRPGTAGDVRSGSVRRLASAAGDGAMSVRLVPRTPPGLTPEAFIPVRAVEGARAAASPGLSFPVASSHSSSSDRSGLREAAYRRRRECRKTYRGRASGPRGRRRPRPTRPGPSSTPPDRSPATGPLGEQGCESAPGRLRSIVPEPGPRARPPGLGARGGRS